MILNSALGKIYIRGDYPAAIPNIDYGIFIFFIQKICLLDLCLVPETIDRRVLNIVALNLYTSKSYFPFLPHLLE